ncbi:MAG: leucine-rich repeat protein, partial [Oscillospiraceae bacterium]|nr:leucine-rich repeat protein [Oscillospiraceae bacterium]
MKFPKFPAIMLAGLLLTTPAASIPASAASTNIAEILGYSTFQYDNCGDHICLTKLQYKGESRIKFPTEIDGLPVTEIGSLACYGPIYVKEWNIPEGITKIGQSAFANCRDLEKITLPSTLQEIGVGAFHSNSQLTEIEWNGCTPVIRARAFQDCTALTHIEIPDGVEVIEDGVFRGCTALADASVPDSLRSIGISYMDDPVMGGTAWEAVQPEGVLYLGKFAIGYKGEVNTLTALTIKDGTLGIASGAFRNQRSLEEVHIPDSVRYINHSAFPIASHLTDIHLPHDLETFAHDSFLRTTNVKGFTIDADAPNFCVKDG